MSCVLPDDEGVATACARWQPDRAAGDLWLPRLPDSHDVAIPAGPTALRDITGRPPLDHAMLVALRWTAAGMSGRCRNWRALGSNNQASMT